jgi:septum formation protein
VNNIVLASSSRWRASLLEDAGLSCECVDPQVNESAIVGKEPVHTARLRAEAKAAWVATRRPDALVIGADQVIHLDGETIGKPLDDADHLRRLQQLRGRAHQLTTAVALIGAGPAETFSVDTRVHFRADPTDDELRSYVAGAEARGCAGGYMVEKKGAWLVERIEGDWLNVVGLPVLELISRLRARGWRMPVKP